MTNKPDKTLMDLIREFNEVTARAILNPQSINESTLRDASRLVEQIDLAAERELPAQERGSRKQKRELIGLTIANNTSAIAQAISDDMKAKVKQRTRQVELAVKRASRP